VTQEAGTQEGEGRRPSPFLCLTVVLKDPLEGVPLHARHQVRCFRGAVFPPGGAFPSLPTIQIFMPGFT
jgi:hypothetical protein